MASTKLSDYKHRCLPEQFQLESPGQDCLVLQTLQKNRKILQTIETGQN